MYIYIYMWFGLFMIKKGPKNVDPSNSWNDDSLKTDIISMISCFFLPHDQESSNINGKNGGRSTFLCLKFRLPKN